VHEIVTIADVEEIEKVPFEQRLPGNTGYEALQAIVDRLADRTAISALPAGNPLGESLDITFAELLAQVNRTANMLRARGLCSDESVTHLLPLVPEALYLTIAAETVGIINPVNPMLEEEHILSITRSANTRVLVTPGPAINSQVFEKARNVVSENDAIHTVYVLGGGDECDGEKFLMLEACIAQHNGESITGGAEGELDDVAAFYHTGGTTGTPKLARHTQRMRVGQTVSTGLMMGYGESDCVVLGLPAFHVAGCIILGLIPLFNGARVLLLSPTGYRDNAAVESFWKVIEAHRVSVLVGVPTVFSALRSSTIGDADLSSLRLVMTGGSAVPKQLMHSFSDMIGMPVAQGFGMTEIGGMGLVQTEPDEKNYGSTGIRGPYIEVKVGRKQPDETVSGEAATDEIGLLCFRGPCVMEGYVGGIGDENLFTADGWLNTGDLARMDAKGEVWITGREKDVIIRSGHNIDALIIEDALQGHPAVESVAAVGKPDTYAGELPIAYVQLKPGTEVTSDVLKEYAASHIAERAAAPTEVILVDHMPKTGIDKIFKPELRLDAIKRTYEAALAAQPGLHVQASVRMVVHPTSGVLASVLLNGKRCAEQEAIASEALKEFGTEFEFSWSPG
jgi:fatty-acyl-CoA synthase